MVWTAEQTGQFLDHAVTDPLYPLLHLNLRTVVSRPPGPSPGVRTATVTWSLCTSIAAHRWYKTCTLLTSLPEDEAIKARAARGVR